MEVHHHAHTARKKWTHYFWEFLMLFLAVFCGFLAENMREHAVEHKRAKVYAANLYKELKIDTANLNRLIIWTDSLIKRFDTLCILSADSKVSMGKLYFFSGYAGWISYFSTQASTMEQLKNSGNQRIIRSEIALKLTGYESQLKALEKDYDLFRIEYETMNNLRLKIFDGVLSVRVFNPRRPFQRDSVFQLQPSLINKDPMLMKEFIGWVKSESDFWEANIRGHLKPLRETATELIDMLKEHYHLK